MPDLSASPQAPNCWQCRHFGITHLPSMPYACRLMGFRSALMPCIEVLRADGQACKGFAPKPEGLSSFRQ